MNPRSLASLLQRIPVTLALCAAVSLVFALELAQGGGANQIVLMRMGALNVERVVEHRESWRLITAMFLHAGWLHFALNTFALVQLAALTEILFGGHRLMGFYLLCGLAGSLASALMSPEYQLASVGASGALYGLVGLIMGVAMGGEPHWREQLKKPLRALVWALAIGVALWLAETVFMELFTGVRLIDHWAHAGGFATGLMLGLAYPEPMAPLRGGERVLAYGSVGSVLGAGIAAFLWGGLALETLPDRTVTSIDARLELAPTESARAQMIASALDLYEQVNHPDPMAVYQRQLQTLSPEGLAQLHAQLYLQVNGEELLGVVGKWMASDQPRDAHLVLALERWVELEPEEPEALNALAWALVTHHDEARRDPGRALLTVDRALVALADREEEAEGDNERARAAFLDTRAEALFQLGRLQEALSDQLEAVQIGEALDVGEIEAMRARLERIKGAIEA